MIFYCHYKKEKIPKGKALFYCLNEKQCDGVKIFNNFSRLRKYLKVKNKNLDKLKK